ncbi:MAG: hypothetical protein K0Q49_2317 [Haloplasmataceae bacterium]|jgi:hypothetical protein|nr:hypothetical protein [Haloplasmataceae bacterium]
MIKIYRWLVIFHAFVGIGALFGGLGVIIDPSGKGMGISTDVLVNAPFDDFLIPGIILFSFVGVCNILTAVTAYKKVKIQAYLSGVMSVVLVFWIVIQCYMLWAINILHVVYFLLGLVGITLACLLAYKQMLFPLNLIFKDKNENII